MLGVPEIEALKALATNNQSWADWSTLIVVLGLIGEIVITFSYTKDKPRSEVILGVLCGLVIAVGVFGEYRYGSRAAEANAKLRTAADLRIAELTKQAGDAKRSADNAADDAIHANRSAQQATNQAGIAKVRAMEVGKQAEELRRKTLELGKKLSDAENAELAERKKVLELENSLAPRMLNADIGPGNKTSFDELKPFAGTQVMIEVLTDAEARRAAQDVGQVLGFAGWKIIGTVPNPELYTGFFDGLTIWYDGSGTLRGFSAAQSAKDKKCKEAAEALAAHLLSKNWKALARPYLVAAGMKIPNIEHEIPPDTLVIVVGFKPNAFFDPDWVKQMDEQYKQFMIQERNREKNFSKPSLPFPK